MKKILIVIIAILIPFLTLAPAYSKELDNKNTESALIQDQSELLKIAESSTIVFYLDEAEKAISIKDKRNGFVWNSVVSNDQLGERNPNELWTTNIKSLFNLMYANQDTQSGDIIKTNPILEENEVKIEHINDGVKLNYNFLNLEIEFDIIFKVEGPSLIVTIPDDSIREDGVNKLVGLSILPFLGATTDSDDGYYFYPNGSGELYNFRPIEYRSYAVKEYRLPIYGKQVVDMTKYDRRMEFEKEEASILLPVYGVKNGENAITAIIEKGDTDAVINLVPGGVAVPVNRIFTEMTYRRSYGVLGSEVSVGGGTRRLPLATLVDEERLKGDREIRYVFLHGEKANYSGMAETYRNNLKQRHLLNSVINKGDKIPLSLDLLMGIVEKKMIFSFFTPMTTFNQAQKMMDTLLQKKVDSVIVNLKGWGTKGYMSYPINYPAARKLGGNKGLRNFSEFCESNNLDLFLQVNYVDIIKGNGGFSIAADAARDPNNIVISDSRERQFLFSPRSSLNKNGDLFKYLSKYSISGVTYEQIGSFIYDDFNKKYPVRREDTADIWTNMMDGSNDKFGGSSAIGGNAYVLKSSSVLKDIPDTGSSMLLGDESVPFYQMVVHGSIPYTYQPVNLFYDNDYQKLKMIEYGYMPHFELTYENPYLLKDTVYNSLFTSKFSNWVDNVTLMYSEFNEKLGDTWSEYITAHEMLMKGVYKVSYSNGSIVYVNYNNDKVAADDYVINAMDYLVVDAGGEKK